MKKLIILIALIIVSCKEDDDQIKLENINTNTSSEMKYLALGDSYTIGESVSSSERWPNQLVQLLRKDGYQIGDPKIIARTGWTTSDLKSSIDQQNIKERYDLVTILIGVNNQYRNGSVEVFREEYVEILNKALELANYNAKNVIVLSIPDWGVSPYAKNRDREKISEEINLFNKVKREESSRRMVKFINITDISRKALTNEDYIAKDGLHFSGQMYRLWADEVFQRSF